MLCLDLLLCGVFVDRTAGDEQVFVLLIRLRGTAIINTSLVLVAVAITHPITDEVWLASTRVRRTYLGLLSLFVRKRCKLILISRTGFLLNREKGHAHVSFRGCRRLVNSGFCRLKRLIMLWGREEKAGSL